MAFEAAHPPPFHVHNFRLIILNIITNLQLVIAIIINVVHFSQVSPQMRS